MNSKSLLHTMSNLSSLKRCYTSLTYSRLNGLLLCQRNDSIFQDQPVHQPQQQKGSFHTTNSVRSDVTLTRERYPNLQRGPFASLTADDIATFESIAPGRVITDQDELKGYNTDWLKIVRGERETV